LGPTDSKGWQILQRDLVQHRVPYIRFSLSFSSSSAAWFEAGLIDFDIFSNQGNWLYIAGRGADRRNGRRFDPEQQAGHYDPDGAHQHLWDSP
jgi:hypothetical protein